MGFDSKHDIAPPLPFCRGFSFAFGCGSSFFGVIHHFPFDGCSAASCSFGVLTWEDECTSFYSTILLLILSVSTIFIKVSSVNYQKWLLFPTLLITDTVDNLLDCYCLLYFACACEGVTEKCLEFLHNPIGNESCQVLLSLIVLLWHMTGNIIHTLIFRCLDWIFLDQWTFLPLTLCSCLLTHPFCYLLWEFYIPWLNLYDLFPIFFLISIIILIFYPFLLSSGRVFANSFYFTNWFPATFAFYWQLPSLLNLAVVFFKFKQSFITSNFHDCLFKLHKDISLES